VVIRLRVVGLAVLAALVWGIAGSCGDAPDVSYVPAAYGEQVQLQPGQQYVGANGQTVVVTQPQNSWVCYFTDSYLEIALLHQAGLCPDAWTPMLMASISQGLMWHYRYAAFYDSPAYYNRYVPVSYRNTYVTHVHTFEIQHKGDIDKVESTAKWKGTDGKIHSGQEVKGYIKSGKASFGSGTVRSSAFSSGSVRSGSGSSQPATKVTSGTTRSGSGSDGSTTRPGSGSTTTRSGSSSSGSFGSGSRSSSSSSSGSLGSGRR
jgi:hypothetical protein